MIYFIGNIEADVCKIGFSRKPYRRIETLRKQSPFYLEVFEIIDGDFTDEKMFHSKYDEYRINGEWFKLSKVIELGLTKSIKKVKISEITLNVNPKNNYIHLASLMAQLNSCRTKIKMNHMNYSTWVLNNKSFIETIGNAIIKETCLWVHLYVAFELIRNSSVENKLALYENIRDSKELYNFYKEATSTKESMN